MEKIISSPESLICLIDERGKRNATICSQFIEDIWLSRPSQIELN